MDNRVYLSDLFDIYGDLLTDKQKDYFIDYYFNNLSLSELSENYNVTRNAVHKSIKETEEKLISYEKVLKTYEKNKRIKEIIKEKCPEILEIVSEIL